MKLKLFKIELWFMLVLAWHCTNAQMASAQTKHILPVSNGSYDADHVYREIDLTTQKKAFQMSKGKKVVVNIYPVKQSKALTNKDIQLEVFFQYINGPVINLSDKVDKKKFAEQTANYAGFLKQKKISGKNVPNTYYASIDGAKIAQGDKIAFYLSMKNSHIDYYLLSEKKDRKHARDSTGKCPPCNLTNSTTLVADSTGKCPPCNFQYLIAKK